MLLSTFVVGDLALGVMFVLLKLLGFVNWEWRWVTCPFWVPSLAFSVLTFTYCVWRVVVVLLGGGKNEDRESDDDWRETK